VEQRGFKDILSCKKRIKVLEIKLGITQQEESEMKFDLLDKADEFLTPEQQKQKRI
jgi:hypothetical protein